MLLIGNGTLITRDPLNQYIADGAVLIDGTMIKETGTTAALRGRHPQAEFVDAENGLIMPGFINAHMHFYSTFSRGMFVPGEPARNFGEVLERLWWRLDKALTLEDTYYSAMMALVDCIKCGTTTVIDHHASPFSVAGSLFEIARAAKEAGIRSSLCYEVSDRDGEKVVDAGIEENISFINWAEREGDPMISGKFGLHASFTLSNRTLEKCREAMADKHVGYHVHVAEGPEDEADSLGKYGKRIVERFHDFGITCKKTIMAHCIHIDDNERRIIRETETSVAHNPESNMGNAVGAADIVGMMKDGVKLGLGTDGYVSDMIQSFRMGNALCKHAVGHPNMGWGELPKMLFENNAAIAENSFPVKVGKIKEGYVADVIIMEYAAPSPLTGDNINGHLLFGSSGRNVVTTIANGKVLMKDRKLTGLNCDEIFAKSRELAEKLWKRL